MAPKITYNNIDVDFDNYPGLNEYEVRPSRVAKNNLSSDGTAYELLLLRTENEFIVSKERITADLKERLLKWFDYVADGSTFDFVLDDSVGFAMDFEGKLVKTNDGVLGTTTRTDAALALDPNTGLLTSYAAATARFEAGKFGQHALVVEDSRVNLVQRPSEFDHADWVKVGISVSTNRTWVDDPEGNNIADLLTGSGSGAQTITYTTATATSNKGVAGVWVRTLQGNVNFGLTLSGTTSGDAPLNTTATPDWQFFQIDNTVPAVGDWKVRINLTVGSSESILVFGAVLFDAQQVIGTPIYGDGATATIGNESHEIAIATNEINVENFSVELWVYPYFEPDDSVERNVFAIQNASSQNYLRLYKSTSNNLVAEMKLADNSGNGATASFTAASLTADTWHHLAVTVDTTADNNLNLYINGALVDTSSDVKFMPIQIPTKLILGKTSSFSFGGRIDEFVMYKNKILSAAEISDSSNRTSGYGYKRNRIDNLILLDDSFGIQSIPGTERFNWSQKFLEINT